MGLFSFFKINKSEDLPTISNNEANSNTTDVGFPVMQFHTDIKDLLWFADSPLKNITAGQSIKKVSFGGVTITYAIPGMEEPSMIFTKHDIEIPTDIHSVERPPYYPTYYGLTPLQKGVYLKLLENPYRTDIDIGFVFILYYGLERHLLLGNWKKAAEVIIKLRDCHKNKSFQQYSANAIILTAIYRQYGELAVELLSSIDKDFEIQNFPVYLFLMCAASFNLHITAKDIMRMSSWFGFDNHLYIKKLPDLFEKTLSEKINEKFSRNYVLISDYLSDKDINELERHNVTIFANTSLRDTKVSIPFITESKKLCEPLCQLLLSSHESVKKTAAEMRKNGTLKPEPKKESQNKRALVKQKTMPELIKDLQDGIKAIPLPAGYSTAIQALHGLRKLDKDNSVEYLKQIYQLAVQYSMYIYYSEYCQCPGYNIIEIMPAHLIEGLSYTYNDIGYNELTLLGKTDIKELVSLWGEPEHHSTLNKMYHDVWHKYELYYKKHERDFLTNSEE